MKKELLTPVLALTLICLVITTALAVTDSITRPVIEGAARERASAARREVLPQAPEGDGFDELPVGEGVPASVTEAYRAKNGAGYVFMITASGGYGGDISVIAGVDGDGRITAIKTLSHSETEGMGAKITEEWFTGQFSGKDSALEGVEAIAGATLSSKAFLSAVGDAFAAYEAVKGT
jgi:electron transport complex protein RnfG